MALVGLASKADAMLLAMLTIVWRAHHLQTHYVRGKLGITLPIALSRALFFRSDLLLEIPSGTDVRPDRCDRQPYSSSPSESAKQTQQDQLTISFELQIAYNTSRHNPTQLYLLDSINTCAGEAGSSFMRAP